MYVLLRFLLPRRSVGVEPLQRHYQLLQSHYGPLHSGYGAVTSRYGAVTNLMSRYGVGWLQRACALQRHSLRHASSEGLCPLGCSLSAPATGGFSVVSPQYIRCAAGSEKEKRAGGRLHGDTIAQSFAFCNGAVSGWRGGSCFGLRPPSAEGLAWPAPLSHLPTLQRFWKQGDSPCTPGGGCAPCTLLGGGQRRRFPTWRVGMLPSQGKGMGPLRSAIQRGHSAAIAPTAVRPRCDGLFPAGAALRRF